MILGASGTAAEVRTLEEDLAAVLASLHSEAWKKQKAQDAEKMQAPEFWAKPERFEVLSRIALMDRVRAAAGTAEALRARLAKAPLRSGKSSKELIARLALQLHLTGEEIKDVFDAAPIEAALAVEPALDGGAESGDTLQWCQQLLAMYRGWSGARNMQISEVPGTVKAAPVLLITGFGAYRALAQETGLHVLRRPMPAKTPGGSRRASVLCRRPLASSRPANCVRRLPRPSHKPRPRIRSSGAIAMASRRPCGT